MPFTSLFSASKRVFLWLRSLYDKGFLLDGCYAAVIFLRLMVTGRFALLRMLMRGLTTAGMRSGGPRDMALVLLAKEMSQSVRTQYFIGLILLIGNQPSRAEAAARHALALRPDFQPALVLLGGAWVSLGFFDRAEALLAAVTKKSPRTVQAWVWRGTALVALGRYDEATEAYRLALACRPAAVERIFDLVDHLLYVNQEDEARALLLKAVKLHPKIRLQFWNGDPDTQPSLDMLAHMMLYQAHVRVGHALLNTGRGSEMLPHFARAMTIQEAAVDLIRDSSWLKLHHLPSFDIYILPPIWVQLISHIALLDKFLKLMELGWLPKKPVILLAPSERVVNPAYLDYWRDRIEIVTDPDQISAMLPASIILGDWHTTGHRTRDGKIKWMIDALGQASGEWGRQKRSPLLSLKPEHRVAGRRILEAAGIPNDAWFVCLHVREAGFFGEGEHPYAKFRNADIRTFETAVRAIRTKGGYVVRVGDSTMTPYPSKAGVFDYALNPAKSDWMDIFLCAECRFFIGSTSGLYLVATTFGVPCVLVNWVSFYPIPWECDNIFLPKLIRRNDTSAAFLHFSELFEAKNRWIYCDGRVLQEHGLHAVDNSPEEIHDTVVEMLERLDGRVDWTAGDAERIEKFRILSAGLREIGAAQISTKFLRRYADLLD